MNRVAIIDSSVPRSRELLGSSAGLELVEASGVVEVFARACAVDLQAEEVLAVGDGTTTLAVASAFALTGASAVIRPIRSGSDGWTEAAGVSGGQLNGGAVCEVATLRVERLGCPWPIVCSTASFGGVAPLLASLNRGGSAAGAVKEFAKALGGAHGPVGWTEGGSEVAWGVICSASGQIGAGVRLDSSESGFVATSLEPARGGGLMGLVRGVAGILGGGTPREVEALELTGNGALALDGWLTEGSDRVRISPGPRIRIVG